MSSPKLIITADDYGMSPLFNRGIEELAELGLITGVSVMIDHPFVQPEKLITKKLAIGLHLELEEKSSREKILGQIKKFEKVFGKLPTYLDGHQHRHLTEHNFPLVVEVAKEFQLPIRSCSSADRQKLVESVIATPHNFISWHPNRISVLTKRIQEAGLMGLSELVVHPGYFDALCEYPYNKQREIELAFLKSPEFQALIAPFALIGYSQLF